MSWAAECNTASGLTYSIATKRRTADDPIWLTPHHKPYRFLSLCHEEEPGNDMLPVGACGSGEMNHGPGGFVWLCCSACRIIAATA